MTLSLTTADLNASQTQWDKAPVSKIILKSQVTNCKILHAIPGRLRISIPQLSDNQAYEEQLKDKLQSLNFVTQVRVNPIAQSIVIFYTSDCHQDKAVQQLIIEAIQGKDPQILSTKVLENLEQEDTNLEDWLSNEISILLNGMSKGFFPTIGMISLILGIIGFILPLVPGTPLLLFSSFCFSRAAKNES